MKKIALVPRKDFDLAHAAHDVLDRQPARAGELRLRLPVRQGGPLPVVDLRRHRHRRRASCSACPTLPVWRGEMQCRGLGMDVDVFDEDGAAGRAASKGELVCKSPFPSMPVGFWNDPDGAKYRAAYFERFPGRLVPRRLGRAHRARRRHHLRPLGRDAQSRRRAHRHRGNLPPGRAAARGGREPGDRPGLAAGRGRRRARRAVRQAARRRSTLDDALAERIKAHDPHQHDAAPRARRRSCRSPTFRAPRAARSSSSRCATSSTAATCSNRRGAGQSRGARAVPRPRRSCGRDRSMSLLAILAALGLEQWRAFEWRASVERAFVGLRAQARAQAQRRHARHGAVAAALALLPPVAARALASGGSPTPCTRCSGSCVNVARRSTC